ncbi:tyrosine-type recombinase/integrase [Parasulfitobacter algicola]|uniref:Integrase arm-type DNA-binding domain-containing protein n=1 Tax=Parasulfitobacter algicola TaxID=2614809 RepID=A0ABX2ITR9_9RHOB|nr:site-specific integrase [Sulfitobacter algicola]NSX56309.1 integrase arm-type DNA-binding domain-containing protein [Sulfitobacter algicola]
MTKKKVTWTDLGLKKLAAPKDRRFVDHVDPDNRGLNLRVSETGTKSWSVLYRVVGEGKVSASGRVLRGKQKRITLGTYPAVTLADARDQARKIKDAADAGIDAKAPAVRAKVDRKPTFVRVVVKFLSYKKSEGLQSYTKMRSMFRMHICAAQGKLPQLGSMAMDDIRRADIQNLLDHYDQTGRRGTANEMQKYLRQVWKYARQRDIVSDNIMQDFERTLKKNPRTRTLFAHELKAVWQAVLGKAFPSPDREFVQVLILSGLRKNELAKACWDDLDEDHKALRLSADRTKTSQRMLHPFSDLAWDILQTIPRFDGPFIFTKSFGMVPMSVDSKLLIKLRKVSGDIEHFTLHDFRRTIRSQFSALQVAQHVAEYSIGHKPQGIVAVYDVHDYLAERRDAFNKYADYVKGLVDE